MIAALVFVALAALTILFHIAIIFGARWGHLTMGGRWPGQLPRPARALSAISAALIALMAWVVLAETGGFPGPFGPWAIWAVVAALGLSVVMHIATPSAPERRLWLPVILVMTIAATWIAVQPFF